jgi:nucleoside-diphosphate-sugar epimerase
MRRVAVTGASGVIGSVLSQRLAGPASGLSLTGLGVEHFENDARLADALRGHDVVVHLAWIRAMGPPRDGVGYAELLPTDNRHLESLELAERTLRAAQEVGVGRAVLASSVHADDFYAWGGPGLLASGRMPRPAGPYGAAKVLLEEQGRVWAERGLEVICVRFGGVSRQDRPAEDAWERRVCLSHADCAAFLRACIEAPSLPERFCVVYAVSDNQGRVHDTSNPFGWQPREGSAPDPGMR